jgi:hypothetical protein
MTGGSTSKRADRPIASLVFPKQGTPWLSVQPLPTEKAALESSIAGRFVKALSTVGEAYELLDTTDGEPADSLLCGPGAKRVVLQTTEAVDEVRIMASERRRDYGRALWHHAPALAQMFSGVQVAFIDVGQVRDFLRPDTKAGRVVVEAWAAALRQLQPVIDLLPLNEEGQERGKMTFLPSPAGGGNITVRLLRFAPVEDNRRPKWLWLGSHVSREGDATGRITRYGPIRDPFWLLAYSLDTDFEPNEELELRAQLATEPHRFERVYIFFPHGEASGELRQLFPAPDDGLTRIEQPKGRVLARLLAEDAMPRRYDPRWQEVMSAGKGWLSTSTSGEGPDYAFIPGKTSGE